MNEQYGGGQGDEPPRDDRPGPYRGVFGSPGQPPSSPPPPPPGPPGQDPKAPGGYPGQYGGQPGQDPTPYGGQGAGSSGEQGPGYSEQGNPWGYQAATEAVPKQVTAAAAISFGLGILCVLGGLFSLTSAAAPMAEMLLGSKDATGWLFAVFLLCGVVYILPAVFLRKRRNWARNLLMVVATFGIAGGVTALPGSILGLAIHVTLLVLMLQGPTKTWFLGVRR